MLCVQSFVFNPFQENTYVISNSKKECWIIDPGMYHPDEMLFFTESLNTQQLKPQSIINTHCHLDHIFGVKELMETYQIPFFIHQKELPVLNNAKASAALFGLSFLNPPTPTGFLEEGDNYMLGTDVISIRFTPGHSPGSVSFYCEKDKWLIAGDTLFNGSIGRTDLPGGNHATLIESIKKQLFSLDDETLVYSGHGPTTTIGFERMNNPFLR